MKRIASAAVVGALMGLYPTDAHAYLDPGTGSMILQGILGGLLVIGGGIGVFWRRIKSFFNGSSKKSS
jgi:hypothetical protein